MQVVSNSCSEIFCDDFLRLSSKFVTKMCGSLLSKFKTSRNKMDPEMKIFPEPQRVASNITVRTIQPLNSTDFTLSLRQVKNAVAFDIPVHSPVRVSRRLRLRKQKVAPKRTLEDVEENMRAAEERKLKELQRIRKVARELGCGFPQPHPSEAFAQATAAKIAAKQAAAESERKKELERKRAGNRASQNRSSVIPARKVDETEKMEEVSQ